MRRNFITFTLAATVLCSCGQNKKPTRNATIDTETGDSISNAHTIDPATDIDTESKFTVPNGIAITIQNSLPKGTGCIDSTGQSFGYRIFWTRVINETDRPLELTINFPSDSISTPPPDSYLKVFLALDTMTVRSLDDYAAKSSGSFLDTGLNKHSVLQRTINPGEACRFYTGALFTRGFGSTRAELLLKGQDLFYRIRGITPELDSALIACGHIDLKD